MALPDLRRPQGAAQPFSLTQFAEAPLFAARVEAGQRPSLEERLAADLQAVGIACACEGLTPAAVGAAY
jgi:hypothetical protein